MNEKKLIILVSLISVVLLIGGVFVVSAITSSPKVERSSTAKAYTVEPTSFDWGTIPYNGPKAKKAFTIKNTGQSDLKLYNIKTSCHCTKAYASINGSESPSFGMSGVSSWVGVVPPGKSAKLLVIFDQTYHGPQGVGPISRFVSVETNDSGLSKITYTLSGTVEK